MLSSIEAGSQSEPDYKYYKGYLNSDALRRPDLLIRMSRQGPIRAIDDFLSFLDRPLKIEQDEVQQIAQWVGQVEQAERRERFKIEDDPAATQARAAIRELATYEGEERWWVRLFALHMMAKHPTEIGSLDLLNALQNDPNVKLRTEARYLNPAIRGELDNTDAAPERPWEQEGDEAEAEGEVQAEEVIDLTE